MVLTNIETDCPRGGNQKVEHKQTSREQENGSSFVESECCRQEETRRGSQTEAPYPAPAISKAEAFCQIVAQNPSHEIAARAIKKGIEDTALISVSEKPRPFIRYVCSQEK